MHFDYELQEIHAASQKGALSKEHLDIMLNHDYDDYNSDFLTEVREIIKTILDNDDNVIEKNEVGQLLYLVGNEAFGFFSSFFDKIIRNNLEITPNTFDHILYFNPPQLISQDRIINYIFNQEDFNLSELQLLKVFTAHKKIAEKVLNQDNLTLSQPLYNYLQENDYYKDMIKDKNFHIVESIDNTIEKLSKELLLTENYKHDLDVKNIPYKKELVDKFLKDTYSMIFDETNLNRDKFTFDLAKKQIDIAVESMNYPKQFDLNTIAQMRKNPNNPFGKLKK